MCILMCMACALHVRIQVSTNPIKAKVQTPDWYNETCRVVNDLHGIQLSFAQSGGARRPDVRTILLTLVSGLVMLSTAKTVADAFLLYVAPRRDDYRLFVEQVTPDFGPDNDAERMLLSKVLARKRAERDELLGNDGALPGAGPLLAGQVQQQAFLPGPAMPLPVEGAWLPVGPGGSAAVDGRR